MSDEELIKRLRNYGHVGTVLEAADRIEALVKYRDVYAEMERIATDALRKFEALRKSEARAERLEAALREIESISVHSDGEIHGVTALRWELAFEQAQGTARDALIGVEHD